VRLKSKDLGISLKKEEPLPQRVEVPRTLDEEGMVLRFEDAVTRLLNPIIDRLDVLVEEETKEPVKKEFACEVIRDDFMFIKEVKVKEL